MHRRRQIDGRRRKKSHCRSLSFILYEKALLQLAGILYFALPGSVRRGFLHTGSLKVVYFNTKNSTATESDLILLMEGSEFAFKVVFIFCGSNIFATIDNTGCTEDKRDLWREIRNPQLKGRELVRTQSRAGRITRVATQNGLKVNLPSWTKSVIQRRHDKPSLFMRSQSRLLARVLLQMNERERGGQGDRSPRVRSG